MVAGGGVGGGRAGGGWPEPPLSRGGGVAHGVRAARGVEHGACRDAGPLRVKTPRLPAQGETPFPFPTTASVYMRR